jgi:hypothetical protein
MIVSSMFYTRTEQTKRVGWWCASRMAAAAITTALTGAQSS